MLKLYTIKALCELTRISVRTLHYYDEIKLLKPSKRTEKGHRRYSENDILRLQQIVTFKFLGFSLSQIKKLLQQDKFNILESLKMQANALAEEAIKLQKVAKFYNFIINQYNCDNSIDWQTVAKIIEVLNHKEIDAHQWYQNYLNNVEVETFKKFANTRTEKWKALLSEVKENIEANPEGEIGAQVVKKWLALADEAYGNQPELKDKLWQGFQAGIIPNSFFPYDQNVVNFLTKAFNKFKLKGEKHPKNKDF